MEQNLHFVDFDGVCKYYQTGDTRIAAADHMTFHIEKGSSASSWDLREPARPLC